MYYRCHTKACATKTIREDRLEEAIRMLLASLAITQDQAQALEEAWANDTCVDEQMRRRDALRLNLANETARLDRLTNLAIDGTIDADTFGTKKHDLILSIAALEDELATQPDPAEIEEDRMAFLELAKSLAQLHIHGTEAEKREIVENAFSNRKVTRKNVDLEPHQWLQPGHLAQGVFLGGHSRDTYRTEPSLGRLLAMKKGNRAVHVRPPGSRTGSVDLVSPGNPAFPAASPAPPPRPSPPGLNPG